MAREIGVIGAGGWGTALAKVLADKGERVTLWCHGAASFRELTEQRQNCTYLPGIALPDKLAVTQVLKDAVADKSLVICAVPSHAVREVFTDAAAYLDGQALLLCGTKGLEEATPAHHGGAVRGYFRRRQQGAPWLSFRADVRDRSRPAACRPR